MNTAVSADGTMIAFDRYGDGPPVIMTVGAFNTRSQTEPLARTLAPQFTVPNYDRRGRGDSGDTAPYSVEREIEDIAALIQRLAGPRRCSATPPAPPSPSRPPPAACPSRTWCCMSRRSTPMTTTRPCPPAGRATRRAGVRGPPRRRRRAVPDHGGRHPPGGGRANAARPGLEAIAHTLAYDAAIIGDRSLPAGLLATVTIPALVITGEQSPPFLRNAAGPPPRP